LQAQNNYINALYQLLIDQVDLKKSLGQIEY
jgi:outer membrane protein TolC